MMHGLHNQPFEQAIVRNEDAMIVRPLLEFVKQVTAGGSSVQTLLEPS